MTKNYTKHFKEHSYSSQYPNWEKLGFPQESNHYVNQAHGKISKSGETLRSEGFSRCAALILHDLQTLESALFHIDEWNPNFDQGKILAEFFADFIKTVKLEESERERLVYLASGASRYWNTTSFQEKNYSSEERDFFKRRMTELGTDKRIKACFVIGDESRNIESITIESPLSHFGITQSKSILAESGRYHWDVGFKPKESVVMVNSRKNNKVLSYNF